MAEKNDGGDKTERPTPKRLQDARKKGDVAKSKDVGSTAVLLAWLLVGLMLAGAVFENFAALFDDVFRVMDQPFGDAFEQVAWSAARRFVYLTALLLLPVALFASLMEFLQTGPVFTLEKMTPKLDHLNPGEGLKRMFNTDNLFEVAKSLVKTALLLGLAGLILFGQFDRILRLPAAQPGEVLGAFGAAGFHLLGWTMVVFLRRHPGFGLSALQLHEAAADEPPRHPSGSQGHGGRSHGQGAAPRTGPGMGPVQRRRIRARGRRPGGQSDPHRRVPGL